ncbi:hypothetical protein Ocin01_14860 [Orchesella cincta]|uniref:Uncharacterized protein n=1 Tax=Orchesella cincta TaxID=48709 RepID=A0A1D2MFZ0_ORCCI|nr:hypothetical protein Ocin01_14860 [Orchesella cincta]
MNLDLKNFSFGQGQSNQTEVVSVTEVVEEKAFLTWKIDGISDDTKWEAIKSQAKCFLELGKNTTQPQKLCFYLSEDGSGFTGLFCKTLNEYQHDVVLKVKIEKFQVDGSSALILKTAIKTLKQGTEGTGNASCCILNGNEGQSTGLFPVRTPTNNIFRNPSKNQPPAKVLGEQDFIRIGISLIISMVGSRHCRQRS